MSQTVFGPKSEVRSLKEFVKDDDKLHPRQKKKVKWLKEEPQIVVGKDNKLEVKSDTELLDEFLRNLTDDPIDITVEQVIPQEKRDISPTAFLGDVSALDSFLESIQKEEEEVVPKPLIKEVVDSIKPPSLTKPKTNKPQLDPNLKAFNDRLTAFERRLGDMAMRPMGQDPGGGETKLRFLDDIDRPTIFDMRYLRYNDSKKKFEFAEVNPHDVVYNTYLVTTPTYTLSAEDYYVGVNYNGPTTITLPAPSSGRMVIIKDESGDAETNPITVQGTVDNDAGGFIIQINNGAIQLIYRNGWRIV